MDQKEAWNRDQQLNRSVLARAGAFDIQLARSQDHWIPETMYHMVGCMAGCYEALESGGRPPDVKEQLLEDAAELLLKMRCPLTVRC